MFCTCYMRQVSKSLHLNNIKSKQYKVFHTLFALIEGHFHIMSFFLLFNKLSLFLINNISHDLDHLCRVFLYILPSCVFCSPADLTPFLLILSLVLIASEPYLHKPPCHLFCRTSVTSLYYTKDLHCLTPPVCHSEAGCHTS